MKFMDQDLGEKAKKLVSQRFINKNKDGQFLRVDNFMIPIIESLMGIHGAETIEKIFNEQFKKYGRFLTFDVEWINSLMPVPEWMLNCTEVTVNEKEIMQKFYPDGCFSPEAWANSGVPYGDLTHCKVYLAQRERERIENGRPAVKKRDYPHPRYTGIIEA
jgi:hypothetical protein